jgi:glycosyltransferase involved in cell wall biosynthesis
MIIDDASTDSTKMVISRYQENYPAVISSILLSRNQRSIGRVPGMEFYRECDSEFLSFCDGDDFWIDNFKLEKQINILEINREVGLVHSDYKLLIKKDDIWASYERTTSERSKARETTSYADFYFGNNIKASTTVLRSDAVDWPFIDKSQHIVAIDWLMYLNVSVNYRIQYLEEEMVVHRVTENGLWNGQDTRTKDLMKSEIRWHCAANLPNGPTRDFFRRSILKDYLRSRITQSRPYKAIKPFMMLYRKSISILRKLI